MPINPLNMSEIKYEQRDLFLDVRLVSIGINDTQNRDESGFIEADDFTGKSSFNVGFFKDGTGFGITNINISINPSLQPIVDIEFKDLYGKTVFNQEDLVGTNSEKINYKALFAWPPPKFEFTFKGYLGQPITWILNMKSTSTTYNSEDGSYTIKAVFIPNQWGMFADIPFLYLYAAKKLRADALNSKKSSPEINNTDDYKRKTQSIIDLMFSGKKVEKIRQQKTKEYDKIVSSLNSLKIDPIGAIIAGNISIKENNVINSKVPNRGGIEKFLDITIKLPKDDIYKQEEFEIISYLKALPTEERQLENIRIKAATVEKPSEKTLSKDTLKSNANILNGIIDSNLELIENAINAILFSKNEEEIKKLTISEIFSQIAKDAAYIMGYILDAGEQGYLNNIEERTKDEEVENIIGLYYPMKFETIKGEGDTEDIQKQVPVKGYGTEEFEKSFINDFITAITYGISESKKLQNQADNLGDNKIKHRINNIELISENPFTNIIDWKEIASIIMKRASVAGYITQSADPNNPGDYKDYSFSNPTAFTVGRQNGAEEMRQLADNDLTNIEDSFLNSLEPEALEELKGFCSFWLNLISDADGEECDGISFFNLKWFGGNAPLSGFDEYSLNRKIIIMNPGIARLASNSSTLDLINRRWSEGKKIFSYGSDVATALEQQGVLNIFKNEIDLTSGKGALYRDAGFKAYTVEQYLEKFIGPNYIFNGRSTAQAKNGVPFVRPTLNATFSFYDTLSYVIHYNGLCFVHSVSSNYDSTDVTASDVAEVIFNPIAAIQAAYDVAVDGLSKYEWLVFSDLKDIETINELKPASNQSDGELRNLKEAEKTESVEAYKPQGIISIDSYEVYEDLENPAGGKKVSPSVNFLNETSSTTQQLLDYNWCKSQLTLPAPNNIVIIGKFDVLFQQMPAVRRGDLIGDISFTKKLVGSSEDITYESYLTQISNSIFGTAPIDKSKTIDVNQNQISFVPYGQTWDDLDDSTPTGNFFDTNQYAISTRVFLRQFCYQLLAKINKIEDENNALFGQILGKAGDSEDLIYQQMHNLFHQWHILSMQDSKRVNQPGNPSVLTPNLANKLQEIYSKNNKSLKVDKINLNNGKDVGGGFRYDYPLQIMKTDGEPIINVADSIINLDHLYQAKADTTVLNMFQQLTSKNNFTFFPIPGNSNFFNIKEIFSPESRIYNPPIGNYFQILFQPTPESRTLTAVESIPISLKKNMDNFVVEAFPVSFGDPTNNIIKSINLSTDEDKVSAESIVSLQKIVDNDNSNKTVSKDCSTLSILEGRSYTAKLDTMGNAQISPMQFFYLQNNRIFSGLYQIKKVEHTITPNDMITSFEGIKISYGNNTYGGIHPVTLQDYRDAVKIYKEAPMEKSVSFSGYGNYESTTAASNPPVNYSNPTSTIQNALNSNGVVYNPPLNSSSMKEVLKSAGYQENSFEFIIAMAIGAKEGYKKGSNNRPSRNNNPGNLAGSNFKSIDSNVQLEPPNSKGERKFAKFSKPEYGAKALIETKVKKWANGDYVGTVVNGPSKSSDEYRKKWNVPDSLKGIANKKVPLTIEQFFYIYAPPSDGNDTEHYIESVVNSLKKSFSNISRLSKMKDFLK